TEGGGDGGAIVDETAAPSISNVAISGKLAVGEALSGSYTFEPNTGNTTDASEYLWGEKGSTAEKVASGKGDRISQSGVVPNYIIADSDAGQVLEMSIQAKNALNVKGNLITKTTSAEIVIPEHTLPADTIISVNNFNFKVSDNFPTTGYSGASFKIEIDNPESYSWSSNASWASVENNGRVTLGTGANNKPVEITMIKSDKSYKMIYQFTLSRWFSITDVNVERNDLVRACDNQGMSPVPSYIATNVKVLDQSASRGATNQLWPEWGSFSIFKYMLSDKLNGNNIGVRGSSGALENTERLNYFICYKQL
ncbi:hypothetical protein NGK36_22475, partial [Hafnia alvei]|nr:hypothetical protein [Hafnia alvei]